MSIEGSRKMTKQIQFTETVLRDGQQSQIATRMPTEAMLPVIKTMDEAGFHALEMWGGATFDACLRFLNEDPWERLRSIRKQVKNSKLQMLLRGQNLLGYKNYADDVVWEFVTKSIENGIDIVRIFDALNDTRNLRTSVEACKAAGGHCQIAISYTTSTFHTVDYFVGLAKEIAELGADSICIKDMAGVLTPGTGFELVKRIKQSVDLPLEVHTHATSGIAEMTYLKAAEAGADIIDTTISSFSGGTSQPATESIALALEDLGFETGLKMHKLEEMADHFNLVRNHFREAGILNPKVKDTEPKTLIYQVPGGMLSNLLSQLNEQGNTDKYEEVLAEVPKVRADLGFPPLVTPLSQMVGTQALMNVLSGERYKLVPNEIKDYVKGFYGKPPVAISEELQKKIIGNEPVITERPADLLAPQLPEFEAEIKEYAKSSEDVLSYAVFPQQAKDFLGRREDPFYDVPLQIVDVKIDIS
jgi:oxaloacetate decarboxylase alpha subunit